MESDLWWRNCSQPFFSYHLELVPHAVYRMVTEEHFCQLRAMLQHSFNLVGLKVSKTYFYRSVVNIESLSTDIATVV